MKVNIAATKTNLLRVKKSLALTREGYQLLDEKRRILMSELSSIIQITDKIQEELEKALRQAYTVSGKAVVTMGQKRLDALSFAINIKNDISLSQRRIMGVSIPVVELITRHYPPYYSSFDVSLHVDEVIVSFEGILKLIAQLAEKKIALLRLAKELQKTVRKVNALEKVYLPYFNDAFKYIGDRLDEESREAFGMLKIIKERMRAREKIN